jgi:sulfotransferase
MQQIYAFLGEPYFEHDFENVQQVTQEDDTVHGYKGMHDIRPQVRPITSNAREILGPVFDRYAGPWVWNNF